MRDEVETILILPRGQQVPRANTKPFSQLIALPLVPLRRTLFSLLVYVPALILASIELRILLHRRGAHRIQFNDFYFAHGAMLRLLGFRGRIVTFVRIDPTRFGIAGKLWLAAARWSANELVAVSRFIQGLLGPRFPSTLIYEPARDDLLATERHIPPSRLFLFVGNLIEGKGQDDAIRAFNRIAPHYPDTRLRLVGGDMGLAKNRAYRGNLEALATDGTAADRIEFAPAADDLHSHYGAAFAALNFSASESFSLTCLEASASALPLIATRCGGPEEIVVDGVTGFLVPVGDVDAMADRMARLLDDPRGAAAMGSAGRRSVAERFSPATSIALLKRVLALPPLVA